MTAVHAAAFCEAAVHEHMRRHPEDLQRLRPWPGTTFSVGECPGCGATLVARPPIACPSALDAAVDQAAFCSRGPLQLCKACAAACLLAGALAILLLEAE